MSLISSNPRLSRRLAWGRITWPSVISLLFFAVFGLSAPKEDVTVALREKVIQNLSSQGLTLAFRFAITNRSSSDRALVRYHYRVTVNDREFLNLTVGLDEPMPVPAGKEIIIALPVKVTYALLFEAVGTVEDRALCDVLGELTFEDLRKREEKVPFAFPGEFPIFKDPDIDLPPLHINDLTLGGADIVFRARFKNSNRYELLVNRISYHLYFGDKEVLAGLVPGDKNVPSAGVKEFSLPFLLDFFESGKEMRDLFQKPDIACRFTGEIEISSVWGPLLIRFDKTQSLAVEKTF